MSTYSLARLENFQTMPPKLVEQIVEYKLPWLCGPCRRGAETFRLFPDFSSC